jgi:hypothetical protein
MTEVLKSFDEHHTCSFDSPDKAVHAEMFGGVKQKKRREENRWSENNQQMEKSNQVDDGVPNILPE